MSRAVVFGVVVMSFLSAAGAARADENCGPEPAWQGTPKRIWQAARSGDRVLVQLQAEDLVIDRRGAVLSSQPVDSRPADWALVGGDAGFWQVTTDRTAVAIDALDDNGRAVGATITLGTPGGLAMTAAQADQGGGVLAVAWAQPAFDHPEHDLHLALIAADRTLVADAVIARPATWAMPVVQGDVVWLIWSEAIAGDDVGFGVRFARTDGARLDLAPRELGRGFEPTRWARAGGAIRLYDDNRHIGTATATLQEDGTVTAGPPSDLWSTVLGTADGAVLHFTQGFQAGAFPSQGEVHIEREDASGVVTPLTGLNGQGLQALADGDDTLLITTEDFAAPTHGVSRVLLHHLRFGVVSAPTLIEETELVAGEPADCGDDGGGCSTGGGRAAMGLPLAAALALLRRRRR